MSLVAGSWFFALPASSYSYWVLTGDRRAAWNTTFWFESVALVAFAVSWLTKGHFYQESFRLFGKVRSLFVRVPSPSDPEEWKPKIPHILLT